MSPSRVTKLPVEQAEYSTPTWNEQLYLQKAGYSQNRVSDAMSFSAIITPLEGLEFVGEMKARLDVENNSFELRKGNYALPNGSVMEVSGNKQGYHYPGMKWQNTQFGSLTRGSVFNYYLSPSVTGAYTRQWGDHFFKGMAGFQMELQENSSEYMYKDGMLSEDIYSFDNANGTPYAAEARSHWAQWVCLPALTGTTGISISWSSADVTMDHPVLLRTIVGDFSHLSLPATIFHVRLILPNLTCRCHSLKYVCPMVVLATKTVRGFMIISA